MYIRSPRRIENAHNSGVCILQNNKMFVYISTISMSTIFKWYLHDLNISLTDFVFVAVNSLFKILQDVSSLKPLETLGYRYCRVYECFYFCLLNTIFGESFVIQWTSRFQMSIFMISSIQGTFSKKLRISYHQNQKLPWANLVSTIFFYYFWQNCVCAEHYMNRLRCLCYWN